jgi:DNA-binding NarL/FixJ family response regulator
LNIVRDSRPPANDQPAGVSLSDQETRVLHALARGLGYRAIADELDLGLDTIRTYVRRIYTKLQTHTAAEAILKAAKAGLI